MFRMFGGFDFAFPFRGLATYVDLMPTRRFYGHVDLERRERECLACRTVKPFDQFYPSKQRVAGVNARCKACCDKVLCRVPARLIAAAGRQEAKAKAKSPDAWLASLDRMAA